MAREFEPGIAIADVYAEALFTLAREAGAIDEVHAELEELVRLLSEQPDVAAFFASSSVDDDDRERSFDKVFRGRLSDLVLNTLQVMNHHDRVGLVPQLLRAYVLRVEAHRGQVEVMATSAVELDEGQRRQVEEIAAALSGRKPLVEYVVDPDVIGGLVLQIGDDRYDNSVRRQLHSMHARLVDRSNRGLDLAPLIERAG
jgi:F-type H+-transporting ATPase subunit delta